MRHLYNTQDSFSAADDGALDADGKHCVQGGKGEPQAEYHFLPGAEVWLGTSGWNEAAAWASGATLRRWRYKPAGLAN